MLPKPEIRIGELLSDNIAKVLLSFQIPPSIFPESTAKHPHSQEKPEIHPFKCSKCPKSFESARGLQQHNGKLHSRTRKHARCQFCNKKFKHKYAVRFHVKQVHERSTRVSCEHCGLECYNKYSLKEHIQSSHS